MHTSKVMKHSFHICESLPEVGAKVGVWLAIFGTGLAGLGGVFPQSEALAALCLSAGVALLAPNIPQQWRRFTPTLRWALIGTVLVLLLSTLLALDSQRALFGTLERNIGALSILAALGLLMCGVRRAQLRLPLLAALVINVWALAWAMRADLSLAHSAWPGRFAGSMGNPAQLGNWALFALVYFLSNHNETERSKTLDYIGIAACAILLLAAGARAALLAAVMVVAVLWIRTRGRGRRIATTALLIVAGAALLWILSSSPERGASVSMRFQIAQQVAQQYAQLPFGAQLFGLGADHQPAVLSALSSPQEFADRAHNVVLDTLLCFGISGVLVLMVFSAAVLHLRRFDIGLAWLAACVTLQFSFALHAELALLACLLAPAPPEPSTKAISAPQVGASIALVALALASFAPLTSLMSVHWRRIDYAYQKFEHGQYAYRRGDFHEASQDFAAAHRLDKLREDYARALAQTQDRMRKSD